MSSTTTKIRDWAIDRGLHAGDPTKQMVKLIEEIGELAAGIARQDKEKITDSIGDAYVVLTILAMQYQMDIEQCIQAAYEEIKNRKGKLINGVFVKESDLK